MNGFHEADELRSRLNQLQSQINEKDNEIVNYLAKIEILEEQVMKLENITSGKPSKKSSKKVQESKLTAELKEKDQEIRDLKNRMGFLRKEKIDLQKEFEKFKDKFKESSVIRVEEVRDKAPLNILVKELQEKLNKSQSLIRTLQSEAYGNDDIGEVLKEKDVEIDSLNSKIKELEQNLDKTRNKPKSDSTNDVKKELIEDLQKQLSKAKSENENLKKDLAKLQKKSKDKKKEKDEINKKDLQKQISRLTEVAENKNKEVETLKMKLNAIQALREPSSLEPMIEELQTKLNKSKTQITILQTKLKESQNNTVPVKPAPQKDADEKLKLQRDMAGFLQKQLDDSNQALKVKEEEIKTIKNEAIRIKNKYDEVNGILKQRENQINTLRSEVEKLKIEASSITAATSPNMQNNSQRVNELKSIIEDLTKQNIQQRLEISQLRKSI